MRKDRAMVKLTLLLGCLLCIGWISGAGAAGLQSADSSSPKKSGPARPITIPVGIRVKGTKPEPELRMIDLTVSEDGEPQTILSTRAMGPNYPITMAVLIQDDLVSSIGNEIRPLAEFIRHLPKGSRVMVGYVRAGSLEVRQKLTSDLEKAANALRAPLGLGGAAPFNPYVEVVEAISRFESQPAGRRAMLLVSDGLDISRGVDSSSATQSVDLQRAINQAQRRAVAVYSFYAPSVTIATSNNRSLGDNAQSSLQRLSDETGGKAFFQGTGAPVSFEPFLRDLSSWLERQIALTYLSTHTKKGFHRLQIRSATPGVEITYPAGYTK